MLINRLLNKFSTLKFQLTRKASVNPTILYETIAHTDKYSSFLPWCTKSTILSQTPTTNETILDVKFGFYNVSYKSHVTFEQPQPNIRSIRSICKQSPFKVIDSIWRIEEIKDNLTQISYKIEFEFENIVYQQAASVFLNQIGEGMYQKFLSEALRVQREIRSRNNLEVLLDSHSEIKQKLESQSYEIKEQLKRLSTKNQYKSNYEIEMLQGIQNLLKLKSK